MTANAPQQDKEIPLAYSVARTPEQLEKRYGKSLAELEVELDSKEGREKLMKMFQEEHPELNGEAKELLKYLSLNIEQLKKKETLL